MDFNYVEGKSTPLVFSQKARPRNKFEECRDLLGKREANE
jgi:hypothetical protein